MDRDAFHVACQEVMSRDRVSMGIGTLGEKTLHAVLKLYFEPDPSYHELQCGPFVADVWNKQGFVEIQTTQLYRLKKKLDLFLSQAPVTVVYPVPAVKRVIWVGEDGAMSPPHLSPKKYQACEILPELYGLRDSVGREGLEFLILLLEVEDYRLLNGWSKDKKRGSTRLDRIPVDLLGEVSLKTPRDLRQLLPEGLGETFTAKEFRKAARLTEFKAGLALKALSELGALERLGKVNRAYVYRMVQEEGGV